MHKINEVHLKRFLPEVLAKHLEDHAFQNERIVDSHHADAVHAVPVGLAAAGDARIHYVVGHEEICLELSAKSLRVRTRRGQEGERERDGPIRRPSRRRPP